MTFDELLKQRRSIRRYQDKPVSIEVIREMLSESTLAPSAGNEQPWKFIIISNKALMKRISDDSKKNILAWIAAHPDSYAKRYQHMLEDESFNVFYNAPSLVLILGRSSLKSANVDCALAASYFMMAAASRGLGTCWVNLGREIHDPEILEELDLPDDCTLVAPIAVGYPEVIPAASKRKGPQVLKVIT